MGLAAHKHWVRRREHSARCIRSRRSDYMRPAALYIVVLYIAVLYIRLVPVHIPAFPGNKIHFGSFCSLSAVSGVVPRCHPETGAANDKFYHFRNNL